MIRSRDGLTRCTACRAHVRVEDVHDGACALCRSTPYRSAPGRGRTALVAAALLAFSACGDPPPAEQDPSTSGAEHPPVDERSNENDEQSTDNDERPWEREAVPAYGVAPRPPDEPMYGVPPE